MKSIRTKILVCMTVTVIVSLLTVGISSIVMNYSSTNALLEQSMTETAKIAAQRVEHELEAYANVAFDAGCTARLMNPATSSEEKKALMEQRAKSHNMVGYNVLEADGSSIFDGKNYSDREYVQAALTGHPHISEPTVSKVTGALSIMVAAPLWEGGIPDTKIVGVVYFKPKESFLNDIVLDINISKNSLAYILDSEGNIIAHREIDEVKNKTNFIKAAQTDPAFKGVAAICQKMIEGQSGFDQYSLNGTKQFQSYAPIEGTDGWSLAVSAPPSDFMSATRRSIIISLLLLIVASVVAVLLAVWLAMGISRPIGLCCDRLEKLAQGDLNSPVPQITSKDETGKLAASTNTIVSTFRGIIGDISWELDEVSAGNFKVSSQAEHLYIGDFSRILKAVKDIVIRLSDTLSQVHMSSDQVSSGSEQVSAGAQSLSQGATEQASSVEELAATIAEISNGVRRSAEDATAASDETNQAGEKLGAASAEMENMIHAMAEISRTSGEIGKVIKTIEDIAFQTNILALNAAVEAARAGQAGKGFAVVADEVRNLANKSAEASQGTADLIESSVRAVEMGTQIANNTAESINEVGERAQRVAVMIDAIAKTSHEQADELNQITMGIDQISSVVQTNSATAEESAAASEELSSQAQMLKGLVEQFKLRDSGDDEELG